MIGPDPKVRLYLGPDGWRRDIHGQKFPRKLGVLSFVQGIPGFAAQFNRTVPPDFWALDVEQEEPVAIVACPCGAEPHVPEGRMVTCPGASDCPRHYLFTGESVHVAGSPAGEPKTAPVEAPD